MNSDCIVYRIEFNPFTKEKTFYLLKEIKYFSARYNKYVTVPVFYQSDGASGAIDIPSRGWWVHDFVCEFKKFDDGSPCSRWQGSHLLGDILREEHHDFRSLTWFWATYIGGVFKGEF